MGDSAVLIFKVVFLLLVWGFIATLAATIRGDLLGRQAVAGAASARVAKTAPKASRSRSTQTATVITIGSGPMTGQRFQLVDRVRIGRSQNCELYLDDEYVTQKHPHAQLVRQADHSWLLTDLGSTNGTFVNGGRLTTPLVVTPADTIQIGKTQLKLEV